MVGRLLSIQHYLNPLHLYCRFLEKGVNRHLSTTLCRSYELILFSWITRLIKTGIHICCVLKKDLSVVEEVARK